MRYESRLAEMAKILGFLKMETGSAAQPASFSRNYSWGAKQKEARMDEYRKKRKVRNKMARESRRRNRAS